MKFNCKEDIIQITPLWKGERMEDGRPKVSSDVLRRLRKITLEEAWGPLWQKGYKYQFEGEFRTTHPGATLVGRAVTGVYVPMRPDLNDYLLKYGHEEEGRKGYFNQWVIDSLVEDDVVVVDMFDKIFAFCEADLMNALDTDDKNVRDERMLPIEDAIMEKFGEEYPDLATQMPELVYKMQKKVVRRWLLDGKRVDGRALNQIRPLAAEVGLFKRVHGSGMFTRGQTQVVTMATLGTLSEAQMLDGIDNEDSKRYMHHYNMPGYSTGEAKATRSPGRREIGHGALAERSLVPVLPTPEEFPYAIRLVSEVVSSNGSTSQASVCGSTLALMDAGVPIKAPVAGISCGLITEGESWMTMIDIQGVEDFYGDMDFKVAGTKKGITAIQVDIKVDGLTPNIIKQAFEKCRVARYGILDEIMLKAIPQPREDVSDWAPKMTTMHINPDKIREVIGKGGSVIQNIVAESGAKVDIEDDGTVTIAAVKATDADKAKKMIEAIVKEPEPGEIYYGKVVRLMNFGAFVNLLPGKDGMVHISKMADHRIEKVEDAVKEGDMVWVKVMEIDDKGRVNLSMKDVKPEEKVK